MMNDDESHKLPTKNIDLLITPKTRGRLTWPTGLAYEPPRRTFTINS